VGGALRITEQHSSAETATCIGVAAMNTGNYEYGLWWLVIINTAVFVLFALSFFKPRTRVNWKAFGGFSAFLVALFTEMYGIPLTLFVLAPWLEHNYPGINPFAHDTGMLWHTVFRLPGDPHFDIFHMISSLLIAFGFLLVYRGWQVLFAAAKSHTLATSGPYRYIRHPQYVGFILIMLGFILMWPTILTVAIFPILVVMYVRLARKEEKAVRAEFDDTRTI
jgi:protein-S-isoprenylcysteine O-methyltransferase Ste14